MLTPFDAVLKGIRTIREAQVVQGVLNRSAVRVAPDVGFSPSDAEFIVANMRQHVGDVPTEVVLLPTIARSCGASPGQRPRTYWPSSEPLRAVPERVADESGPLVSVIMPVHNECARITACLESVLSQDFGLERMEVLVVDGMSSDGTRAIVQAWMQLYPNLRLVDNPRRIVPTGFNAALRRARGEVIVRVDGHCEIASDYVRRCVELLQRTGADNVGGLQRAVSEGWVGRAIALATSSPFGVGGARFHYAREPGWADTVYLGAYRREVFDRIGGFDEELVRNQDDEFNFRLTQAGGRIWLDPSIRVIYYSRPTLRRLWQQYFEYGIYKVRVAQKRGGFASPRHLVPAAFVIGLATSVMASFIAGIPLLAFAVAGTYAIASLAASLWAARHDWRSLPVVPLAFAAMHLSYGLGFLLGIWRWRQGFVHRPQPSTTGGRAA